MEGIIKATKWFAQRIEWKLCGNDPRPGAVNHAPRMFDREMNEDIVDEAEAKLEELREAIELGTNVQEKCFELGACALMIAFNVEAGKGEEPAAPKKVKKSK